MKLDAMSDPMNTGPVSTGFGVAAVYHWFGLIPVTLVRCKLSICSISAKWT